MNTFSRKTTQCRQPMGNVHYRFKYLLLPKQQLNTPQRWSSRIQVWSKFPHSGLMIQAENKMQLEKWKINSQRHCWQRDPISSGSEARKGGMKINSADGWNARLPRLQSSNISSDIRALSASIDSGTWQPPHSNGQPGELSALCGHWAVAGLEVGRTKQLGCQGWSYL